ADFLHVFQSSNPGYQGAKDHQSDDHSDQPNKGVSERFHRNGSVWADIAEDDGHDDTEQNLKGESRVERLLTRKRDPCGCSGRNLHHSAFLQRLTKFANIAQSLECDQLVDQRGASSSTEDRSDEVAGLGHDLVARHGIFRSATDVTNPLAELRAIREREFDDGLAAWAPRTTTFCTSFAVMDRFWKKPVSASSGAWIGEPTVHFLMLVRVIS